MKYIDEYRNAEAAKKLAKAIAVITSKKWNIMEICGGQTHSIVKYGIDALLPKEINLIHGPGCPVCVTPVEIINKAIEIASAENVIFCSFGDMLRVPGSDKDLLSVKASGGDVRIVYSPMDAVNLAVKNPGKEVVFFAVGFETTAPANAMAVFKAKELKLNNFSILNSHVLVPPAIKAILSSPNHVVQGFLAAGHVCTVMGFEEYYPIAEKFKVPIVITGFEPVDILQGLFMCIKQLEEGRHEVENQYARSVKKEGNVPAQNIIKKVFRITNRKWRGVGEIPFSGLGLNNDYIAYDAEHKFKIKSQSADEPKECIAGEILQGIRKPDECPQFGNKCTPEYPLGAPMVSTEGACAAYYRYRR